MQPELSPRAAEIAAYARSLLATGGYHGFSYADISASVHISKASVHHHFPTKAELVRTVLAHYREEARAGMTALEHRIPDPLGQLEAYTGYWATCIRNATSSICICAMLAAELPALPPEVANEVRAHFASLGEWLAGVLTKGADQGVLVLRTSPEIEAAAFMATVHGAMLSARAHGDPELFQTIMQPLLQRLTTR